jgi:ribonuclease P/MRP protein subunit RPP1
MQYYDLDVKTNLSTGENAPEQIAAFAQHLGWNGMIISDYYRDQDTLKNLKEECKTLSEKLGIEVYPGVTISVETKEEMNNIVKKVRNEVILVIVQGGNYAINRAACENAHVDILMSPELNRPDPGLDEACLAMAEKNNISIGVSFRQLLYSYRRPRARIISFMKSNINLCKKMKIPVVVCSGAQTMMDMRDPRQLVSIGNVLGLELPHAFNAISSIPQQIIEKNKKRLEGKIIGKGVELA